MFTKRIIPCLDVKGGRVVKGVNFVDLIDAQQELHVPILCYTDKVTARTWFYIVTDKLFVKWYKPFGASVVESTAKAGTVAQTAGSVTTGISRCGIPL